MKRLLLLLLLIPLVNGYILNSSQVCVNTNIDIKQGDGYLIEATGIMKIGEQKFGPEGTMIYNVTNHSYEKYDLCPTMYHGAVVGRVGSNCIYIGRQYARFSFYEGNLQLCINDNDVSSYTEEFFVTVEKKNVSRVIPYELEFYGNKSKECIKDSDCANGLCNVDFICIECNKDDQCKNTESINKYCENNSIVSSTNKTIGSCNKISDLCKYSNTIEKDIIKCNNSAYCKDAVCVDNVSYEEEPQLIKKELTKISEEDKNIDNINPIEDIKPKEVIKSIEVIKEEPINKKSIGSQVIIITIISLFILAFSYWQFKSS